MKNKKEKRFEDTAWFDHILILFAYWVIFLLISLIVLINQSQSYDNLCILLKGFIFLFIFLVLFRMIYSLSKKIYYKKSEESNIFYKELQCFINEYVPFVKLIVNVGTIQYNASADSIEKKIKISHKWFNEGIISQNSSIIKEYVKCTLLHELFHIQRNENIKDKVIDNLVILLCPIKKCRKRVIIKNWIEELSADKYAYELYPDSELFNQCMIYKSKMEKRDHSSYSHPSWKIRCSFIANNIPVTYENVEREFVLWKGKKYENL